MSEYEDANSYYDFSSFDSEANPLLTVYVVVQHQYVMRLFYQWKE